MLCGVQDLRDYRIHARSEAALITGGSAFNIKVESLWLGDFNAAEVMALFRFDHRLGQPPIRERTSSGKMPSPQGPRITVIRA